MDTGKLLDLIALHSGSVEGFKKDLSEIEKLVNRLKHRLSNYEKLVEYLKEIEKAD